MHDIGHLIHKLPEDAADHGIDTRHEQLGQAWLARYFGPDVTEPIRLHVPAKRYLCATDADYLGQLSPASLHSLKLQGGPLDEAGRKEFEQNPHYREAVALRRWDDLAKIPGMQVAGLDHYRAGVDERSRPERQLDARWPCASGMSFCTLCILPCRQAVRRLRKLQSSAKRGRCRYGGTSR